MEQQEYNDLQSQEEIVTAISDLSALLTAMSGTNTVIASAIAESNDKLDSVNNGLTLVNKSINTAFDLMLDVAMPNIAIETGIRDLTAINRSMLDVLTQSYALAKNGIETKVEKPSKADDASFINSITHLIEVTANDNNAKNFKKNATIFSKGIDMLILPIEKLISLYESGNKSINAIDKTTDLLESISKSISKSAKSIAIITGSILALFATIALAGFDNIAKFVVVFPIVCASLALGLTIVAKAGNGTDVKGVQSFALGVSMLTVSMLAFQFISWESVAKGIISIAALGTTLALVSRLMSNKQLMQFNKSILSFTGSLLLMAVGLAVVSSLAESIPWQSLLKGAGLLLVTAGILALAGLVMKAGASDIGKSFGWIALGLAAFGLSLVVFQKLLEDVSWQTMAIAAVSIVGLAAAVRFAGNAQTMAGAAAMLAIPASLMLFGLALKMWPDKNIGDYLIIGSVLGVTVAAYALAGNFAVNALLGAATVAAVAGSILILGLAIKKWPFDITIKQYAIMSAGIGVIIGAMALIGNPLTLPFILTGIAESAALGGAIYALGKGLQEAEKVNFATATKSATNLVKWAKDSLKIIASMSLKDMIKSNFGLTPFKKLGTALGSIAIAVNMMAAGTYNEYDSAGNIVKTQHIGQEQYAAVGDSIQALLNSVTVPLQEFGKGGGFLRDSDAEKGLKALSNIGDIVNPIIKVAEETDRIKKADFVSFGNAVTNLVAGIKSPIENIGKNNAWWQKKDFKQGLRILSKLTDIVSPIVDIATNAETITKTDFSIVGKQMTMFFTGITPAMQLLADNKHIYKNSTKAIDNISVSFEHMQDILSEAVKFAEFDETKGKSFSNAITSLNLATSTLITNEQKLPETSKLASQLQLIQNGFNKLDTDNLELIVDTANAIETIANADFSKLERAKNDVANELYKRIDKIIAKLVEIDKNTEPQDIDMQTVRIDETTGKLKNDFRLEDARQVNLATVCYQLDQLYGLIAAQRV